MAPLATGAIGEAQIMGLANEGVQEAFTALQMQHPGLLIPIAPVAPAEQP